MNTTITLAAAAALTMTLAVHAAAQDASSGNALSRILEEPCGGRARDCGILGILSPEQTN